MYLAENDHNVTILSRQRKFAAGRIVSLLLHVCRCMGQDAQSDSH